MLALTLLFACGTTDPGQAQTVPTVEDMDAALERIEALEAQIAALQAAVGVAPVEDADHDGYRDSDGLPVGTRRGDVLWEGVCASDSREEALELPSWAQRAEPSGPIPPAPLPFSIWMCTPEYCGLLSNDEFDAVYFNLAAVPCDQVWPKHLVYVAR